MTEVAQWKKHTLLFATNNRHKIEEIQSAVGDSIQIKGLEDAGIFIDIPEPYDTLHENAAEKSSTIYALTGMSCFSEDTGLEVNALNGEPGVRSAHAPRFLSQLHHWRGWLPVVPPSGKSRSVQRFHPGR